MLSGLTNTFLLKLLLYLENGGIFSIFKVKFFLEHCKENFIIKSLCFKKIIDFKVSINTVKIYTEFGSKS